MTSQSLGLRARVGKMDAHAGCALQGLGGGPGVRLPRFSARRKDAGRAGCCFGAGSAGSPHEAVCADTRGVRATLLESGLVPGARVDGLRGRVTVLEPSPNPAAL